MKDGLTKQNSTWGACCSIMRRWIMLMLKSSVETEGQISSNWKQRSSWPFSETCWNKSRAKSGGGEEPLMRRPRVSGCGQFQEINCKIGRGFLTNHQMVAPQRIIIHSIRITIILGPPLQKTVCALWYVKKYNLHYHFFQYLLSLLLCIIKWFWCYYHCKEQSITLKHKQLTWDMNMMKLIKILDVGWK